MKVLLASRISFKAGIVIESILCVLIALLSSLLCSVDSHGAPQKLCNRALNPTNQLESLAKFEDRVLDALNQPVYPHFQTKYYTGLARPRRFEIARFTRGKTLLTNKEMPNISVILEDIIAWRSSLNLFSPRVEDIPFIQFSWVPGTYDFEGYDISDLIPGEMNPIHGTRAKFDGPNCWDFAMYLSGATHERVGMADTEFSFWLNSALLRKLEPHELPQPGDLIAIRHKSKDKPGEFKEIHAAIYISPRLVLTKNGSHNGANYELADFTSIVQYMHAAIPASCLDPRHAHHPECTSALYFYRFTKEETLADQANIRIPESFHYKRLSQASWGGRVEYSWLTGPHLTEKETEELKKYAFAEIDFSMKEIINLANDKTYTLSQARTLQGMWLRHWARVSHLLKNSHYVVMDEFKTHVPWNIPPENLEKLFNGDATLLTEFQKTIKH